MLVSDKHQQFAVELLDSLLSLITTKVRLMTRDADMISNG